ncbi:MAG TPA: rod shape-determining protein MreC [Pyrinomonadaceae bacterium]|nr:rod shape-determining protein MreC [Pyrinomonadaceae bacterium]
MRTQKEIRQRAPVWLVAIIIANFGLMSFDARDPDSNQLVVRVWAQALAGWVQRPVASAGGAGVGFFRRVANSWGASEENERLRGRLAEVETQLREAQAARDENERLKQLLGLKEEAGYGVVPAKVIARDPSVWFSTIIINRGSSSGVDLNMPVVTREGIVGRVVAVSPWTAQVMLLTDERSGAGAVVGQLGASSALGSVRGLGRNDLLEMNFVPGLAAVNVGDYVVTTGQDGIYPPGHSVGTVVEVQPGSATTPHQITVRPSARLDSLEQVAVLQYHPPERAAPERTLPNVKKQ